MEYQAVGTNEDTIAQINERVVLTTAGIAQLKELCDKMEQATRQVVWGICGELGKKGVADFASEQLKTGVDMTKPQPCTKFEDAVTVKWVAKLLEETNEVIQETPEYRTLFENGYSREYPDRAKAAKDRIALELTDVIHVCVSWLNAMGYDEDERGELHRRVNEKNRERGYF